MPSLWNLHPLIRFTRESLENNHFQEGWKEFLHRSGSLPLKLPLFFETLNETHYYSALQPFTDRPVTQRWEHLTIYSLDRPVPIFLTSGR